MTEKELQIKDLRLEKLSTMYQGDYFVDRFNLELKHYQIRIEGKKK